jgi:hypothetical protein
MSTTRSAIHTFAAVFTATAVITGCKPAEKPAAPPAEAPPPAPAERWTAVVSGVGYALVHNSAGVEDLRIACARSPARFLVRVETFTPIASEERLSFGADDHVTALVAQSTAPGPGVDAEAPPPMNELAFLPTASKVSVSYGAQTLSVAGPGKQLADALVEACSQAATD